MKKPTPKAARKGIPPIIWVWLGWLVFWVGVSFMPHRAVTPSVAPATAQSTVAPLTTYVNDFAAILKPETSQRLEAALAQFEQDTSNQVAVATYSRLPHGAAEEFSLEVAELSRLGRKGLDNGVILFVFVEDHLARLEVGYGLEGSLTDVQSHRILDKVFAPPWNAGNHDAAVEAAASAVMATVRADFKAGKMPGRAEVFWRQLKVEVPRFFAKLPAMLVAVPIEGRIVVALFGSFFLLGFYDGFQQAKVLVRNAIVTVGNLRAGRAAFRGTAATGTQSMVDSMKVLIFAGAIIAGLAGIVMIAGGGAFGSAGSTLHW